MHGKGLGLGWVKRAWRLEGERLCDKARSRTGLNDFGDPQLEPVLSLLLKSLEEEAGLHSLGRFLMSIHLRDLLETRLKLRAIWEEQGAASGQAPVSNPIFIVGMPRSGSTFLHELLAEIPEHRVPRVWEIMFPAGSSSDRQRDQARRIRKAEMCLWWFRKLAPKADAVYPMRAMTPHECVAMHSYTFMSEEFVSTCNVPSYEAFLRSANLAPAYAWEKRFLQHLQFGEPSKRWVLKSPDHVYGLQHLFEVFPDAWIVQTHRNPAEVIKSSADLTRVLRGLYGRPDSVEETREREARVLAEGAEHFIQFRDTHPELSSRFIDVKYTDLIADPMATVHRICAEVKSPLSAAARERVQKLALSRGRYTGPRSSTQPADPHLKVALNNNRFERYCSRFGIPFGGADAIR